MLKIWGQVSMMVAATLAAVTSSAAVDEAPAEFYRDRIVRLIVGFPPGGPNDTIARHVARLLPAHAPGPPRVVVQNMPGAGSMKAAEYLALQAPRDGAVFGAISTTVIIQSIMGSGDDPVAKLNWLGSAEAVTRVCYTWKASGVTSVDLMRTRGVVVGATGVGSPTSDHARLLKRALGDKVRIVQGYSGAGELFLAMERGEIEAVCGNSINTIRIERPDWYSEGRLDFVLRFSDEARGEAATLPSYVDLLPPEDRAAAVFIFKQDAFTRAFVLPPDIPADRLSALRTAFESTLHSAELRDVMIRAGGEHSPLSGADMARMIDDMRAADPNLKERARQLLMEP
ncbi:MAG: Bug family tripartite tricarboxylate transporter substrate binding protein [Beijerinckiaceae bacterium]